MFLTCKISVGMIMEALHYYVKFLDGTYPGDILNHETWSNLVFHEKFEQTEDRLKRNWRRGILLDKILAIHIFRKLK